MLKTNQMNKLFLNPTGDKETVRLKYTDLLNNDINDYVELLSKSQMRKIEKSKKMGKGVDLTFTKKQIDNIKQQETEKRLGEGKKIEAEKKIPSKEDALMIGKEISENKKLNHLFNLIYDRYIKQYSKSKYSKGIEFLMLVPLVNNKKFLKSIPDISKLNENQINRLVNGLLQKKVGTGLLGDVFNAIKNAIVKTVSTTIRILKNTTVKFISNLEKKYTPMKIIETLGNIALGVITENPAIIGGVITDITANMGDAVGSAFKDSIKEELQGTVLEKATPIIDMITPENIQKGMEGVETISSLL